MLYYARIDGHHVRVDYTATTGDFRFIGDPESCENCGSEGGFKRHYLPHDSPMGLALECQGCGDLYPMRIE